MKHVKVLSLLFLFIILLVGGSVFYRKKVTPNIASVPVVVALKWLHQAQFAGNYVAVEKGFYLDKGLAVSLIPFDMKQSPIDLVASGAAMFGVAGADEVLLARSQGIPVVALAVVYQESPVVAYTLKSSGIDSVADFKGKRVGYEPSDNVSMTIDNMIQKGGLDPKRDIVRKTIGFDASSLINNEVDIATGYSTNEPLTAIESGHEVILIRPSQYGVLDYADVLFTTEQVVKDRPQLTQGFVTATLKGWDYSLLHQGEAIELVMQYVNDQSDASRKHQEAMLKATEALIRPSANLPLGVMSYTRWHRLYEEMKHVGIITKAVDINGAYTQAFLTE